MNTSYYNRKSAVVDIINSYREKKIEISPNVFYSQKETLDRINRTIARAFAVEGEPTGVPKTWFDTITSSRRLYKSRIESDLKDIRAYDKKGDWIAKGLIDDRLDTVIEENGTATLLNELTDTLVDYGSTVLYHQGLKGVCINPTDIIIDPTAKSINSSEYIIIKKRMLLSDMLTMETWDKASVQDILNNRNSYTSLQYDNKINVYYAWIKEIENNKQVRKFYVYVERLATDEIVDRNNISATEVFCGDWIGELPFYEAHLNRQHNRWLGQGVVELLFDAQERANELATQSRMALAASSTQVWLSNVQLDIDQITELPHGAIINAPSTGTIQPKLERVDTYERSLSGLNAERDAYDKRTQDIVGSYEVAKGGETPATMPATNASISDRNSKTMFAYDREQFEIMFEKYLNKTIKPLIMKSYKLGDSLNIEDPKLLKKLNEKRIETEVNRRAWNKFFKGEIVDDGLISIIRQQVVSDMQGRGYKYDQDMFAGKEISLRFIISEQEIPMQTIQQNTFTILQPLLAKYGIENPITKQLLYSWADISGMNMFDMDKAFMEAEEMAQKAQSMQTQQLQAPIQA